ncbi:hybrid sensor histidine kinase/response regulator [Marinicella litoralis]|uniref:histidine kinase n=1 Tax=Marinicella litoralis TaxID=644220 RepID=A0A4R6XYZ4_9GAMM|nr:hybrid sensor histidine kinase/response regulator [Marinicella litoralis]TDR23760.1 Hpt sensor hybrid histidine kinase [Marinicella litoralis]
MIHLQNNKMLLFLLSLLMLIVGISETGQFLVSLMIFSLVMMTGWIYSLRFIKDRFDEIVEAQVNRTIPIIASLLLATSFWLIENTHTTLFTTLTLLWLTGVLLFANLNLKNTAAATAAPILALAVLLVLQPAKTTGLTSPLMFALLFVLTTAFLLLAAKLILSETQKVKAKKNDPLPSSLAKQVKKTEDAKHEVKSLRAEIKDLQVDLSAAEMAKMEFLATMSHEIRTPLNGIVPLIDIVMDTELNDFQRDYLNTAHTSATQMQKLIDDLLDYSKVEAGKLTIEVTGIKLNKVVDEVLDSLKPSAERKGLEVTLKFDDQINPLLRGDPIRIRQVLTNILSNAIKFSDHGRIAIEVKKVKNFATNELIRFSVSDQGIGIAPDHIEKLFNAFTQGDNSSTRKFGGTGLGLAISKKIVELLKGQIGVESKKGVGSTFWFEVPFTKSAGGALDGGTEVHQHQAILINTNPTLFKSIQNNLEKLSLPVQTSLNYQHAISRVQAARGIQDGKTTLLFIDFDTNAKTLRQILMLVEKGELDDVWICAITKGEHIAGVKQYKNIQIIKPDKDIELLVGEFERRFAPEKVMELDEQQEERDSSNDDAETEQTDHQTEASDTESNTQPDLSNISETVLLVEDNEVNLKVAQKLIDYIGFPFDVAENGMVALNKAKKTRYRLILMDCQMPVMDGYFCTKRIRKYEDNHQLNHTPIIAMTANAMLGDKEKCLEAGMDDYMSKPLNRYVLEKTLKKWDPFAAVKQSKQAVNKPEVSLQHETTINPKWLNVKALAEIKTFMGNETNSLLDLFQQESPEMLNQLKTFSQTQDFGQAKQIAHTLKSTGANIGATGFSHFCKKIEAAAIEKNLEDVMQNIEKARKAYVLTVNEIKKYKEVE